MLKKYGADIICDLRGTGWLLVSSFDTLGKKTSMTIRHLKVDTLDKNTSNDNWALVTRKGTPISYRLKAEKAVALNPNQVGKMLTSGKAQGDRDQPRKWQIHAPNPRACEHSGVIEWMVDRGDLIMLRLITDTPPVCASVYPPCIRPRVLSC